MNTCLLPHRPAKSVWAVHLGLVLLCLATMVGCQGFSSAKAAASGTTTSATAQLSATPATLAAGEVVVGSSVTVSGSLNASGTDVTVTAATTNNSRFAIGGLSLPVTIAAGQSAPFTLTFSPQVAGAGSATLTFTSNAQPSTTTESATGTGTAASTHTVALSWNASTSANIAGYNIYRAPYSSSCGIYSKVNGPTLNTTISYVDASVADGTNYCYATTAVNSTNEESGYSNIVSNVQVP
jgi:Abnormal spindle-like microcephaly-assoc'd, ASPM-SPD-2-Hydin